MMLLRHTESNWSARWARLPDKERISSKGALMEVLKQIPILRGRLNKLFVARLLLLLLLGGLTILYGL
ncbi:MAG TPA: hypothetical protein DCM27_01270 [Rhodospirillaceae bacterium]|nr:hypothetical protein [Rhodospirillaceae bacterium]